MMNTDPLIRLQDEQYDNGAASKAYVDANPPQLHGDSSG